MARRPTRRSVGIESSYIRTPVGLTAVQATREKQPLLALVAIGALLVQIFTVSMSALWDRNPGLRSSESTFPRDQEFRTVPAIFTYGVGDVGRAGGSGTTVSDKTFNAALSNNLGDMLTSWLYAGIVEGSSNATASPWTNSDWVFAPVNLIPSSNSTSEPTPRNVTLSTASLRGRLECNSVNVANHSEWLFTHDLTNKTLWNDTKLLPGMKVGYELKSGFSAKFDKTITIPFSPGGNRLVCCSNQTGESVGKAAVGYWTRPEPDDRGNLDVIWITGYPLAYQFKKSGQRLYTEGDSHWIWKDIPSVSAMICTPVFESANASVKVDLSSGIVYEHKILNTPAIDPNAFQWKYAELNVSAGLKWSSSNNGHGSGYLVEGSNGDYRRNMTASYGHLFRDALLASANLNPTPYGYALQDENLEDRTFNLRLPGLNVDFMSYTALSLVRNDVEALHAPDVLANVSSTVFSMFFKHFVQAGSNDHREQTYMNGSWGLQSRGAVPPADLGPLISNSTYLQNISVPSNTSATVTGLVTMQIEQLDMNPVAVILSLTILCFLLLVTVAILAWYRRNLRLLPRDVDSLASVLGFVYASERLLAVARRQNESHMLVERGEERARMGWFESGGKRRWGIEIVDEVDNDTSNDGNRKQGQYLMLDVNEEIRS